MPIYGSSPLYEYVELVFRCKRMFIIAILAGTLITSGLVYLRSASYTTTLIAGLAGEPETAAITAGGGSDTDHSPAARKTDRLAFWIRKDPDFLRGVLRDAHMNQNVPPERFEALVRRVRNSLTSPVIQNEIYMELSLTWNDPRQAEAILGALYNRFAGKTLDIETANSTNKRLLLEQQFRTADEDANAKASARVKYLVEHYWQQPTLMASAFSNLDRIQNSLEDTHTEMAEAQQRLQTIDDDLAKTPQFIVTEQNVRHEEDPTAKLEQKKRDLQSELNGLLERYADRHPAVIDQRKKIADVNKQIADAKKHPLAASTQDETTQKTTNPKWDQLQQMKIQYAVAVKGLQQREADLQMQTARQMQRVTAMPVEEKQFATIDRAYQQSNQLRNQLADQMAAARIDEERDKFVHSKSVKLVVAPTSEKLDSGGKAMLLYALGPLMGVIIGFGFSLLAESLDHTLRTPVDVERHLGKTVLAVLPKMPSVRQAARKITAASNRSITS